MKLVRTNDRFWFGKHKGSRVIEIIKGDPNYIQKIVKEGIIKLDEKSSHYFESKYGSTPDGMPIRREPRLRMGGEIRAVSRISNFTEDNVKKVINILLNEIVGNNYPRGINRALKDAVIINLTEKAMDLNLDGVRDFKMSLDENIERESDFRSEHARELRLTIIDPLSGDITAILDPRTN
jgi:hypothetical protein